MFSKTYTKTGKSCRVTFRYLAEGDVESVNLVGEFNDWDEASHPMKQRKDGSFSTTISLAAGESYRWSQFNPGVVKPGFRVIDDRGRVVLRASLDYG